MSDRFCLQMVSCGEGCCGNSSNGGNGNDSTPVGTVISYMGTRAPEHYMICDGAEFNIADYPQLTQQIESEFGAVNFFGGDGTTTFAVPDLRGEFLRGSGTGTRDTGSGAAVGAHQNATIFPMIENSGTDISGAMTQALITNPDLRIGSVGTSYYAKTGTYSSTNRSTQFTSRPTNTAVLYCIKYE